MRIINIKDYDPTLRTNTLFVNLQRRGLLEHFTEMTTIQTKRINGYNGKYILQPKDTRCIKQDKIDELIKFLSTMRKGNTTKRVIELLQRIKNENSALGMRCDKIEDFVKGTDTKSANLPQNPQSLHSHTANPRILENDSSENAKNKEAQTLESKQNAQILASGSLQKTSNDGALAHDFESVVGGRGESRERGGGERLRNLSPLPLSQNQEQIESLNVHCDSSKIESNKTQDFRSKLNLPKKTN